MNKATTYLLIILTALSCAAPESGWTDRKVPGIPLEKWSFSKDGQSWEEVSVPHSYNSLDGHSESYYRGTAHYKRTLPAAGKPGRQFLLFEGVAQAATLLCGEDTLAVHSGAYTPFWIDVTGLGGKEIEVICDNSENWSRIPLTSDFNKNGGIHNPVWLLELPQVYLSPKAYGLYRLHISTPSVSESEASGEARSLLCNAGGTRRDIPVVWSLKDAAGKTVLSHSETLAVEGGASMELAWDFTLSAPRLWNGTVDPYLYTVCLQAGEDEAETEIGFRYYNMDPDKGFSLNGKPYPLRGVGMHQDKEGLASALWKADFDADYAIVRDLGCNFLRLAHYPHNDYAFRLCDRMGIVVQTEIPWVNNCGTEAPQAYFDTIFQQMEEMVSSLYNHPSIIFWGMWNELDRWGHTRYNVQGVLDEAKVVEETARLYDFTKKLDPYRFVGVTDDSVYKRDGYSGLKADFFSENRYNGWYYSRFETLTRDMDQIHASMGITNLSEYGVGVNPWCHTWKEEDIRRDKSDSLHMEEYGNRFHESYAAQIANAPYLNFASIWIMFDFAVAARQEGFMDSDDGISFHPAEERKYLNDKGIVTRDRALRKDAFYLYKSLWNKTEETVYITSRRLRFRPACEPFVLTVYSNAPSLKLFVDGKPAGEAASSGDPTGVVWKFPVKMGSGPTRFRVQSPDGTFDEIETTPL